MCTGLSLTNLGGAMGTFLSSFKRSSIFSNRVANWRRHRHRHARERRSVFRWPLNNIHSSNTCIPLCKACFYGTHYARGHADTWRRSLCLRVGAHDVRITRKMLGQDVGIVFTIAAQCYMRRWERNKQASIGTRQLLPLHELLHPKGEIVQWCNRRLFVHLLVCRYPCMPRCGYRFPFFCWCFTVLEIILYVFSRAHK